tara:strand:- start:344 stop:1201 length:858 start_codon:yes stop_codon:yes gene_type:complete
MKIIDSTTYFEEDMMIDLRLNILNDYVDHFIISEARFSHSGAKKEIKFDINKFPKFKDKIIHLIVDNDPTDNNIELNDRSKSIKRISYQRDHISSILNKFSGDDYIIHSDNDEIPNLEEFDFKINKNKIIIFQQILFYYKFNLGLPNIKWFGSKACKIKDLLSISNLREVKNKKYNFFRIDTLFSDQKHINLKIIKNGGWHFSNFKTIEELERKLLNDENHSEFKKNINSKDEIIYNYNNKLINYNHNADKKSENRFTKTKLENLDNKILPKYVIENQKKYSDWF